MNVTNDKMFLLFCDFAALDYIAQDDVVRWSTFRRWVTRLYCDIGMTITGLFWRWKTNCPHSTGTVLFSFWKLSIVRCDYGCNEIHFEWLCKDGVTRTFFTLDNRTEVR